MGKNVLYLIKFLIKIRKIKMAKKEYQVGTKTFTEEDFKNPPPIEEMDLDYKMAYADWALDNGLAKGFNTAKEAIEWLNSDED